MVQAPTLSVSVTAGAGNGSHGRMRPLCRVSPLGWAPWLRLAHSSRREHAPTHSYFPPCSARIYVRDSQRRHTAVKKNTKSPTWDETFIFPIASSEHQDLVGGVVDGFGVLLVRRMAVADSKGDMRRGESECALKHKARARLTNGLLAHA